MSKRKLTSDDVCRLWELHNLGTPNVKIADELKVSERTVRHHPARGPVGADGVGGSLRPEERGLDRVRRLADEQPPSGLAGRDCASAPRTLGRTRPLPRGSALRRPR